MSTDHPPPSMLTPALKVSGTQKGHQSLGYMVWGVSKMGEVGGGGLLSVPEKVITVKLPKSHPLEN